METQSIDPLWSKSLKPGIEKLLSGFYNEPNFEELYRAAYTVVLFKHGQALYEKTRELIREHLDKKVRRRLFGLSSTEFLVTLKQAWDSYEKSMDMIRCILMYMDRHYAPAQNLESVYDLGLSLFRESIVFWTTREYFNNALLEMMAREQRGENIDRQVMEGISLMLTRLNINEGDICDEDLQTRCLTTIDFEHTKSLWSTTLKPGMEKILTGSRVYAFDMLYQDAYLMVLHKHGQTLYENTQKLIHDYLVEKVRPKLAESSSATFLFTLKQTWNDYRTSMLYIGNMLRHMDQRYVPEKNLESVYDLGLRLFRENIILFSTTREYLNNAFREMMTREQHGEIIDRTAINDISLMLTKLNINKADFYDEDLQTWCSQ
ncbi:unnamed protein product [Adineta steineri]|nr:unnamed protein product [Adineta steineri]CAF1172912.1 unnamed protein product [Adineta steineri]CAF3914442.1 unnamed protein product [Adineta steineri]